MRSIQGIEMNEKSKEELLPDFKPDFPYIATCAELNKYIEPIVPWHWHRTVELFYMESGCLEYTTPNGKWSFPAGSGGFINSNVLHTSRIKPSGDNTIQLLHLFDPSLISGEHGNRMDSKYIVPLTTSPEVQVIPLFPESSEHLQIIEEIRQAFKISNQDWGYEFLLREALTKIWLSLFELARPNIECTHSRNDSDVKIKIMIIYIHEHFQEQISVVQLADAAHISKRACFRLFQENLHMTPMEYIRSCRLQKACKMLTRDNDTITQIAYNCGLGSSSYFGKVFREQYGCSPAQYRKNWHNRDII